MSDQISKLVRSNIRLLKPYTSARQEFTGSAQVLLDANENAYADEWNRYPDPMQQELKKAIGTLKSISTEQIFIGNGSDEGIDLLIRIFCKPGQDNIIVTPPTFSWFKVCADVADVEVRRAPLSSSFALEVPVVEQCIDENSKILFLCSPNNPTGNEFGDDKIEELLKSFPGIVVIDEAYKDFSQKPSWMARLSEFPRLVITQTLSKAWGKAGLRVGMIFASPEIIHYLNSVKPPYNVNELSQTVALETIKNEEVILEQIRIVVQERERISAALTVIPGVLKVFPSATNFILVRFDRAKDVYVALAAKGIVVRDRSTEPGCENCLRITIGTVEENDLLLEALRKQLA